MTLLRYASAKNLAQPQATALCLGSSHSAVILSSSTDGHNRVLATFGLGQLFSLSLLFCYVTLALLIIDLSVKGKHRPVLCHPAVQALPGPPNSLRRFCPATAEAETGP